VVDYGCDETKIVVDVAAADAVIMVVIWLLSSLLDTAEE
jgi:hypothetical protein